MKTRETTPGKTYAVTSPNGCTVTTEDGLTLAEVEASKQGYFVAVGGKVQLSDEAAVLTQLFKLAPYHKLRLLGVVGGGVPAWLKALKTELTALLDGSHFELAWLASKKTLVVHTDRVSDELLAAVKATAEAAMPDGATLVQYNHNMEISWRDINKYAACTNIADMIAVNPDFKKDLTSDGEWVYPLPEMVNPAQRYPNESYLNAGLCGSEVTAFLIDLPKATSLNDFMRQCERLRKARIYAPLCKTAVIAIGRGLLSEVEFYLPNAETINSLIIDCPNLERIKIYAPKATNFSAQRNPKLREIDGEFPMLSAAEEAYGFAEAQLNKDSTLRILNSIPAYTSGSHRLTIGIHVDHKTDEEVLEAIANAEAKGWSLTVQWNGTPTAQAATTYGLRKPSIYARVSEIERPDGTVERHLEWGHYVTDPTVYEEFRSVEAAREYYGLPAEDLTNN